MRSDESGPNTSTAYFAPQSVFLLSVGAILLAVALTLVFEKQVHTVFSWLESSSSVYFGWLFIALPLACFIGAIAIACSRVGSIRLGGEGASADYPYLHWLAMLFCAGMGAGIVFWGVAEPVVHFVEPPLETNQLDNAILVTFVNWGFHAWALFAIMSLALAYFAYNRDLPLSIRSLFYPFLGDRIYGPWGHFADILAVVASVFGLATSLGLGVSQIATGLQYSIGFSAGLSSKILLIVILTSVATLSVVLGVSRGVLRLSYFNLWLALGLFVFVVIAGPIFWVLMKAPDWFGSYLNSLIWPQQMYHIFRDNNHWAQEWTTFYMAWWLAWAPMTGLFIARISRGRTLREFVIGVLVAPTLVTLIWFCVFGGAGLHNTILGDGSVSQALKEDVSTSFFALLATLPFSAITELLALLLIIIFFITSADSGALSISTITAGGHTDISARQRMIWPMATGGIAAVLLVSGGLKALQAAAVASALPFAFMLVLVLVGMTGALWKEYRNMAG